MPLDRACHWQSTTATRRQSQCYVLQALLVPTGSLGSREDNATIPTQRELFICTAADGASIATAHGNEVSRLTIAGAEPVRVTVCRSREAMDGWNSPIPRD